MRECRQEWTRIVGAEGRDGHRWTGPVLEALSSFQVWLAGSSDVFRTVGEGQVLQRPALDAVIDLMFSLRALAS